MSRCIFQSKFMATNSSTVVYLPTELTFMRAHENPCYAFWIQIHACNHRRQDRLKRITVQHKVLVAHGFI